MYDTNSIVMEHTKTVKNYVKQLDEKEKKAFQIAKEHLGSSFHVKKSVGYQNYTKSEKNTSDT